MAIESLVGLGIFTFGMLLVSIYARRHRAEGNHDKSKQDRENHTR